MLEELKKINLLALRIEGYLRAWADDECNPVRRRKIEDMVVLSDGILQRVMEMGTHHLRITGKGKT